MVTPPAIDWKRIAAYVAYMTAAVLTAMIVLSPKALPEEVIGEPRPASSEDQARILLALVRYYATEGLPLPPPEACEGAAAEEPRRVVVLARESLPLCAYRGPYSEDHNCPKGEIDKTASHAWRQQLIAANSTSRPQPDLVGPLLRTWSVAEYLKVIDAEWWDGFYARHPGTSGFTQVSWAVLSDDGTKALVYVDHRCGGTCGTSMLHVMVRDGDRWRIDRSAMYWIS